MTNEDMVLLAIGHPKHLKQRPNAVPQLVKIARNDGCLGSRDVDAYR